jgi:hypothetical protein
MYRDCYASSHTDVLNDHVGKIGKYRYRLILASREGFNRNFVLSLFYHIAIIGLAGEPECGSSAGSLVLAASPSVKWMNIRLTSRVSWRSSSFISEPAGEPECGRKCKNKP